MANGSSQLAEVTSRLAKARAAKAAAEAEIEACFAEIFGMAAQGQGASPTQEYPIDLEELAKHFKAPSAKAMGARLDRPDWRWLRKLGDKHRDGKERLWLLSEVKAEQAARRRGDGD